MRAVPTSPRHQRRPRDNTGTLRSRSRTGVRGRTASLVQAISLSGAKVRHGDSSEKAERFQRALKGEGLRVTLTGCLGEAMRLIGPQVRTYNEHRLHGVLSGIWPDEYPEGPKRVAQCLTKRL